MKKIFTLFSLLTFAPMLFSLNITTIDGTVYKNAQVVNTMPDGILISFVGDNDFDTVKLVKFQNLPANIQKKYGYNPKKAKQFEKEHQEWLTEQQKAAEIKNYKNKESNTQKNNSNRKFSNIKIGEADTVLDDIEKSTDSSQEKAKLSNLINKLDNTMNNNQSNVTDESSIDGLVHGMVSSTEEQVKEINKLTSDDNTE